MGILSAGNQQPNKQLGAGEETVHAEIEEPAATKDDPKK
jgi:hypothetical protein